MAVAAQASRETHLTAEGSEDGERRVREDMAALVELLRSALPDVRAIFLVGGFGRGEGAIVRGPGGPRPCNDYDLLVVYDRLGPLARLREGRRLRAIAPALSAAAGVAVDVALQDRPGLLAAPPSVLWHEIAEGHHRLWGEPDVAFPRFEAARLPEDEAILLLTNRASALLAHAPEWEGEDAGPPPGVDLIDATKLILAWGDALLLRAGRYTSSYAERPQRLQTLPTSKGPFASELAALYEAAIAFKLRATLPAAAKLDAERLPARVRELHPRFLAWFEGERLGAPVTSWRAYADPGRRKLSGRAAVARMVAKHILRLGPPRDRTNVLLHARPTYERLISILPLLLFSTVPEDWDFAAGLLNARPTRGPARWRAPAWRYLRLWK